MVINQAYQITTSRFFSASWLSCLVASTFTGYYCCYAKRAVLTMINWIGNVHITYQLHNFHSIFCKWNMSKFNVVLKNISYEFDLYFLILSKLPKFMDNKKCTTVHIQSGLYVNLVPFRIYNKTFLKCKEYNHHCLSNFNMYANWNGKLSADKNLCT